MSLKNDHFFNTYWLEFVLVLMLGIFGRLIPHLPNVTPLIGLCLFSGAHLTPLRALLGVLAAWFISDIGLAYLHGYPAIGYFTLFTYSGAALMVLLSSHIRYTKKQFPFCVVGASCAYWIWTNLGVWLSAGIYPKTLNGLVVCYYMALPFLRNALIGDLVWSYLIFGAFYAFLTTKARNESYVFFGVSLKSK